MTEKILCAAIWYSELNKFPNKLNIPPSQYLPINIPDGIVFCGHRHLQCLRSMNVITGLKQHEAGLEVQGFLTSTNRFVDRKEALKIAIEQHQLYNKSLEEIENMTQLYSEDLY